MGPAPVADQQRIALRIIARALGPPAHADQTAVGIFAAPGRDAFGDDAAAGVAADVDHLGARIGLLAVVGHGHGVELARGIVACEDAAGVLPCDGRTGFDLRPRQARILAADAALGDEIIDAAPALAVAGIPILHGGVLDLGIPLDDDLDDGGMQLVLVALGRGATLEIADVGTLVGDDERTLELPRTGGVDAEVGGELHGTPHPFGDVAERPVGEDGGVQCGVVVIGMGHDAAEVLADQIGMIAQGLGDRTEDDAHRSEGLLERGLDRNGVHDGVDRHACEGHLLLEGNAELIERALELGIDLVHRSQLLLGLGSGVVDDLLEIDRRDRQMTPRRGIERQPMAIGRHAPLGHPCRFALFGGDQPHDLLVEPLSDQLGVDLRGEAVLVLLSADMLQQLFFVFGHSYEITCKGTKSRVQCQIYLNIAKAEYLRRSQRYEINLQNHNADVQICDRNRTGTGTLFYGVLDALEKSAKKYFRENVKERNFTLFQAARDWIVKEELHDKQSDIKQLLTAIGNVPDQCFEKDIRKAIEVWQQFSDLSLIQIQRIELVDYICDIWRTSGIRDAEGNIIKLDLHPEIVFKPYGDLTEEEKCLHYIIYKTISIFETYPVYENPCRKYSETALFFEGERPDFKMFRDEISGKMIPSPFIQLSNDWSNKTHTTLKLRQTYNYCKTSDNNTKLIYNSDKFKNNNNADHISIEFVKLSKDEKMLISQIENMPPAIFYWDIYFETLEKTLVGLDTFSSGEKQKIYNLSAIVYHLQNLDSVSDDIRRYEAVNIILEEIELYFHPEWQRTYCNDLMNLIYKSGLLHIKAINILFVTHSPYLLSDIPKTNVLFLKDGLPNYSMQENTFGSNINGLLKNGFFLPGLPIGEFAHRKINSMFAKLHSANFSPNEESLINIYQDIIRVGEPAIRHQLMMLYKVFK